MGRLGVVLEPSWGRLGRSWGHLGAVLGGLGVVLGHLERKDGCKMGFLAIDIGSRAKMYENLKKTIGF